MSTFDREIPPAKAWHVEVVAAVKQIPATPVAQRSAGAAPVRFPNVFRCTWLIFGWSPSLQDDVQFRHFLESQIKVVENCDLDLWMKKNLWTKVGLFFPSRQIEDLVRDPLLEIYIYIILYNNNPGGDCRMVTCRALDPVASHFSQKKLPMETMKTASKFISETQLVFF